MRKVDTEGREHAEYSASGSTRWLKCPGSHELSKTAPAQPDSPYALEGTQAHACLEFMLKNQRSNIAALRKTALKTWPEEMVDHAQDAVDWIRAKHKELGDAELLCETKVDSSPFTCTGQFGTLDFALVQEFGKLVIGDYKYGAGVAVDPEGDEGKGNSQLVYYALALSYAYDHNFTEVELVVIQPRAYHHSGNTVRSMTLSIDELLAWKDVFREGVMETNNPHAKFAAGSWCRFCPAAVICPELKTSAMQRAQAVFSETEGLQSIPKPELIPIPNLGTMLEAADRLEDWIGKVREHAFHVLSRGGEVQGYKLVQKRATRKWKDAAKATAEALKKFGQKAFSAPELLSPAQLEKLTLDKDWVAARVTAESSGTTIARADDKREAVKPIAQVFGS